MSTAETHIFILNTGPRGWDAIRGVDNLIKASRSSTLICPNKLKKICSAEDIVKSLKYWPIRSWASRPWIIAGCLDVPKNPVGYDGPFIEDCHGSGFEQQINSLLESFDWALFGYFTSYQSEYWTFVTRKPELCDRLLSEKMQQTVLLGSYHGLSPYLPKLKNASFYDRDLEGRLAYELAIQRGEDAPYLLCALDPDNPDSHRRWDSEAQEMEEFDWFAEPLSRLACVDEICVTGYYDQRTRFMLHRVIDFEAYLQLWAMASYDYGIAVATFSGDCDIAKLKGLLARPTVVLDIFTELDEVCSWAYEQCYGGGSGEHHAVFHSRDAAITQQIWEAAGESAISRF